MDYDFDGTLYLLILLFRVSSLLLPWMTVFPFPGLLEGLQLLVARINLYT